MERIGPKKCGRNHCSKKSYLVTNFSMTKLILVTNCTKAVLLGFKIKFGYYDNTSLSISHDKLCHMYTSTWLTNMTQNAIVLNCFESKMWAMLWLMLVVVTLFNN